MENKPLYTYAIKNSDGSYAITNNAVGIPIFETKENAERDFNMFKGSDKN